MLATVTIFDIIWLIIVWKSWTGKDWASPIWNRLRFWHLSVIVMTIVNIVLKLLTIGLVFMETRKENPYS